MRVILRRGASYQRQRAVARRNAGELDAVVRSLVAELRPAGRCKGSECEKLADFPDPRIRRGESSDQHGRQRHRGVDRQVQRRRRQPAAHHGRAERRDHRAVVGAQHRIGGMRSSMPASAQRSPASSRSREFAENPPPTRASRRRAAAGGDRLGGQHVGDRLRERRRHVGDAAPPGRRPAGPRPSGRPRSSGRRTRSRSGVRCRSSARSARAGTGSPSGRPRGRAGRCAGRRVGQPEQPGRPCRRPPPPRRRWSSRASIDVVEVADAAAATSARRRRPAPRTRRAAVRARAGRRPRGRRGG